MTRPATTRGTCPNATGERGITSRRDAASDRVARLVAFVIGRPQSGKTSAGLILGRLLGTEAIDTSTLIAEHLERTRGLERGAFLAARASDPDRHRGELGRWGSRMASRNGWSAARIAVARGYRVVSGCRRFTELVAAEREAARRGLEPWPIYLRRPGAVVYDNTDVALSEHAAIHGSIVVNDGDLEGLETLLAEALAARLSLPSSGRRADP